MNKKKLLYVLVVCLEFSHKVLAAAFSDKDCESSEGFKLDAQDEFQVKHAMRKRGRKQTPKVTEAEVSWNPQVMLDNPRCFSVSQATLQFTKITTKDDENVEMDQESLNSLTWETVSINQRKNVNGMRMKWKVDLIPCFRYYFKVGVHKKNDETGNSYETEVKILQPANKTTILKSDFLPEAPVLFEVNSEEKSANFNWEASHCVHSYEFSIKEEADEVEGDYRTINSYENTVNVEQGGLKSCTKYEAYLQAHLEGTEKYSEHNPISFATKPTAETSDNVKLDNPTYGTDFISFALVAPWSSGLNCLKQYRIEICPDTFFNVSDSTCSNTTSSLLDEITHGNPTLETKIESLIPCTSYHLMITPIFDNIGINSMTHSFRTLPPGGDFDSYEPKAPTNFRYTYTDSGDIKLDWDKSECADEYKIHYNLMDTGSDSEKEDDIEGSGSEEIATTNSIILSTLEPCSLYAFAINTHFDGKESNYLDKDIIVQPKENSGQYISNNLISTIQGKTFSMTLDTLGAKLQCINQYKLTLCKSREEDHGSPRDNTNNCLEPIIIDIEPQVDSFISYEFDSIDFCTNYELKIRPMYPAMQIDPAVHTFTSNTIDATLVPVTGVFANSYNNGTIKLAWNSVKCAVKYVINQTDSQTIFQTGKEIQLYVDDVPFCSIQNFEVYAVLDDGNNTTIDDGSKVSTITKWNSENVYKPENLSTNQKENSVTVTWQSLPCISVYEIEICTINDGNQINCANQTISSNYPETEEFQKSALLPCTEYTLRVIPIFSEFEVSAEQYRFKTLTPDAQSLSVTGLQANNFHNGTTILSWDEVRCASFYQIFRNDQNLESDLRETFLYDYTSESCSTQNYQVVAILDNGQKTKMNQESSKSIATKWKADLSYSPPDMSLIPSATVVDVTWNSLPCINEYIVETCPSENEDITLCISQTVVDEHSGRLQFQNTEVKQCKEYSFTIYPMFQDTTLNIDSIGTSFTTPTEELKSPQNLKGTIEGNKIKLTWDAVDCSTKYVIKQVIDGEKSIDFETTDLEMTFENIVSCSSNSFDVIAISGVIRSLPQSIIIQIPPNMQIMPNWNVIQSGKMITIDIEIPKENSKCKTRGFEVTHNATGTNSQIIFDEGSGINLDLFEAKFDDQIEISGAIIYENDIKDGSSPKYITDIFTLEEPTTVAPKNERSTNNHSPAPDLRPTVSLVSLTCITMAIQYNYQLISSLSY